MSISTRQNAKTELKEISHHLSHLQVAVSALRSRLDGLGQALHRLSPAPWGLLLIADDAAAEVDDPAIAGIRRLLAEFTSSRKIYGTDEQGRLTVLMQASAPEVLGAAELVRRRMARMPRRARPANSEPNPEGVEGGEVLIPRSVSIGVAVSGEGLSDPGQLMDDATRALDEAQQGGRNRVRVA